MGEGGEGTTGEHLTHASLHVLNAIAPSGFDTRSAIAARGAISLKVSIAWTLSGSVGRRPAYEDGFATNRGPIRRSGERKGSCGMQGSFGQRRGGFGKLRRFAAPLLFGFGLALSACGPSAQPLSKPQKEAMIGLANAPPKLEAGEKMRVTVYSEPSLSGEYRIDPSGFVSLPLAGTIKATGLTEAQFAEELAEHLSHGYLKNPKITVSITRFTPFYILGEIRRPGSYPYTAGMNVFNAIAIAGGLTYRANHSVILIEHEGQTGMHAYDLSWPIPILPGDIIKVPMRYF